jgi:chromosome partitioning protein
MADIIAVLNQKGGSGKTTLATSLACAGARRGLDVLLADADPQGTARNWRAAGPEEGPFPSVVGADHEGLGEAIEDIEGAFDVIVIDGPPGVGREGPGAVTVAALKAADLVLIPVQPSAADIWASGDLAELVQARQEATGTPDAAFVVTQADARTRVAGEVSEALSAFKLPVLDSRLGDRVAFTEALGQGTSVMNIAGRKKAAAEVQSLTNELKSRYDVFEWSQ